MYQRDEQGRIRVPVSVGVPSGDGIGDGAMWVSPGDPDYPQWDAYVSHIEADEPPETQATPNG